MKKLLVFFLCFLPCTAHAVTKLAVCDGKSYDVTINNGGQVRTAMISPSSGEIEEYGPVVSFQIAGHPPVISTEPYDEYCIWHGHITMQTRNVGNEGHGGGW